ncbi:1-deoxy-D-xylulose-5-phosphate reductoisomerase [Candidatus Jidaibacter acanthamoebae]|nr:1-deoxy-D-xylulose-5-phosphate reductoisomerase [Candidatus Jidaibacter acanthamoeba]
MDIRTVQIQGSTGSIGTQTLKIIREHPDKFKVKTLSARSNWKLLAEQAVEFDVEDIIIENESFYNELKSSLSGKKINIHAGSDALIEIAGKPYDVTIAGIMGVNALEPTVAAIKSSKVIGLANKESIICASEIMLSSAYKYKTRIIPVDSEHSAIFQSLDLSQKDKVASITLTASGGPFRNKTLKEMENVTPEEAVNHPNWKMGGKISVDSATLMNKGLELIEACKLFNLLPSKVEVIIHPESIIHGLVNYDDGSTIAQLSHPNMCVPISYALFYPDRLNIKHKALNLSELSKLHFEAPDYIRFPLLKLAIDTASKSQSEIIALNVANEVAVKAFLQGKIKFLDIYHIVNNTLEKFNPIKLNTLQDTLQLIEEIYLSLSHL